METDRELLERAAKAAGMDALWGGPHGMQERRVPKGEYAWVWNPLVSDGDALRLAVKRRMHFEIVDGWSVCYAGSVMAEQFSERHDNGDPNAATRRAIVRAAASLATKE
jgi:hypothetical protein